MFQPHNYRACGLRIACERLSASPMSFIVAACPAVAFSQTSPYPAEMVVDLADQPLVGGADGADHLVALEIAADLLVLEFAQHRMCLGAAFRMMARLGRHELALDRIGRLAREEVSAALRLPLLQTLSESALNSPDARVRHYAADVSRVLIARQLIKRYPA